MESLQNKSLKLPQKQQQTQPGPDESYTTTAKCSKNLRHQIACRKINKNLGDDDGDDDDDDNETSSCSTSASADLSSDSDEIPVWVNNEKRYISGITQETTCIDLVEALLEDECVLGIVEFTSKSPKDYIITERWKKVEQVLDGRTNILKIWNAWGSAQQEVKFTLRPFEGQFREMWHNSGDRDSGRGSPTGSINSAIVRRKRHKASKSSFAWMTHGQTIHPKSQKTNIERLMKLILEQGEIIQQQLSKLRDRETEITTIEDERHKLREKEHGKNYLLETYLKGLQDSAEEKESGVGNSDSGVHTEEATTSPEIAPSPLHDEDDQTHQTSTNILQEPKEKRTSNINSNKSRSRRETELRIEHETIVKSLQQLSMKEGEDVEEEVQGAMALPSEVSQQIEALEKIVNINKQLQKEEELLVRLGAKIKRYEADASGLSEQQVLEALEKVNLQLTTGDGTLLKMELDIKESDKILQSKSLELKKLYDELEEVEVQHNRLSSATPATLGINQDFHPLAIVHDSDLNLSREYLAENMYNVSKMMYNGGSEFNAADFSPTTDDMFVHPIEPPSEFGTPFTPTLAHAQIHTINDKTSKPPSTMLSSPSLSEVTIPDTPITDALLLNTRHPTPNITKANPNNTTSDLLTQMNYLPATLNKYHQRNINNVMTTTTNLKLGPKKLINGVVMHELSNNCAGSSGTSNSSDTGVSSLGEQDFTQLGTLV